MKYTIDNPKLIENIFAYRPKSFTGVVKDKRGNIVYYKNGKFHREDGPAIEWHDGVKEWFIHDKRHREDGPAVEYADGSKQWYYNDKFYGWDAEFTVECWIKKCGLEIFK